MSVTKYAKNSDVVKHINESLLGYRGYVQFSHRSLEKKDIFENSDPCLDENEEGFVYEAHFCDAKTSVMIRQQNAHWVVSTTDISELSEFEWYALEKTRELETVTANWVKMAQVWKAISDPLCDNTYVLRVEKVVFAGFTVNKGEKI
jgi:CRISPR type III-associated protein (TIGR04423 family)